MSSINWLLMRGLSISYQDSSLFIENNNITALFFVLSETFKHFMMVISFWSLLFYLNLCWNLQPVFRNLLFFLNLYWNLTLNAASANIIPQHLTNMRNSNLPSSISEEIFFELVIVLFLSSIFKCTGYLKMSEASSVAWLPSLNK